MANISKVDRNFQVQTSLDIDNIVFYDPLQEPFSLHGVFYEDGMYRRLPEAVAKSVSKGVYILHTHTAGGRLKFITDSSIVAIKATMPEIFRGSHATLTGNGGFDLYVGRNEEYYGTFIPPYDIVDSFESVIRFPDQKKREITINFPLYGSVSSLYVGLEERAVIKKSSGYKYQKPIAFYGSSITQGGCASRPGNCYQNVIARALKTDYVNLGFSGNAKAEDEIAQYIKDLDMSVFVYDYDHNAPTVEHLEKTHQKMFGAIRQAHPDMPVVILSRPKYRLSGTDLPRLEIIKKTYTDALAAGDRNVYFIDGPTLMKYAKNEGTVDGCHPNDLGFYSMAKVLIPVLRKLL